MSTAPDNLTLKSNGHERELYMHCELSEEACEQFGYVEIEDWCQPRFFEYRGAWYDVQDCEVVRIPDHWLREYDGFFTESAFSAVLFKYTDDFDAVIVTYAHW